MREIEITRVSDGNRHYFRYLEEVAEWLTRWYSREVYVSDLENQIDTPYEGCDFIVFGEKYHYKQFDFNKEASMWVARDKDGTLCCYFYEKPRRITNGWIDSFERYIIIDKDKFPDLRWEDEPIEVELVRKEEKR